MLSQASSNGKRFKQIVHFAAAVSESVQTDSYFIQEREVKICQRCRLGELYMSSALHSTCGATGYEDRQVDVVMDVRIAHAAAIKIEGMVQQRPISIGCRFQFSEKFSEERNVELIDLCHLGDLLRIVAVMGERMMGIRDADFRIGAIARFSSELEGNDPGDIALQCQHLQIEHQPRVVRISGGYSDWPIEIRQRIADGVSLRFLNAPLDLAHRLEVLADFSTITRPKLALQAGNILVEGIEQAGIFPQRGPPLLNTPALAEEALKNNTWVGFGGQRCRRR